MICKTSTSTFRKSPRMISRLVSRSCWSSPPKIWLPENSRLSKVAVSKRVSSTPTPRIVTPDNLEMLMKPLNFNPDTFLDENEEMAENTTHLSMRPWRVLSSISAAVLIWLSMPISLVRVLVHSVRRWSVNFSRRLLIMHALRCIWICWRESMRTIR